MTNTISMQDMRHLNLFERITKIRTRYCFSYNDTLMFVIPKARIAKALGKNNENLKKMSGIVKKRIRVVPMPNGIKDAKNFIQAIVNPISFNAIDVGLDEIVLTAGPQNKAALLGRNKRRLSEMQGIIASFFKLGYRIV